MPNDEIRLHDTFVSGNLAWTSQLEMDRGGHCLDSRILKCRICLAHERSVDIDRTEKSNKISKPYKTV